ncbi:MAG: hypothetical protein ABI581_08320 [Sediminibacterium sp.]
MKLFFKNLLLTLLVFIAGEVIAQPPHSIGVTSVAQDPLGNVAKNRTIYVKDIIYQFSPVGGVKVWEEAHVVTSNTDGVYTIYVGAGTKATGILLSNIGEIAWGNGPYFINYKVAIAPSIPASWWVAADNYVDVGTTQMLSVPYALYAGNASVTNVNTSLQPGPPNTFLITDSLGNVNWQTPQAAQQSVTTITNLYINLLSGFGSTLKIGPNTTALVEIKVTGVRLGDPIVVTPQADYTNWAIYSSWVSQNDYVKVRFANFTDEEVIVEGSQYKIVVIKY